MKRERVTVSEFRVNDRYGNKERIIEKSRVFLILRRSRTDNKQNLGTEEMCSDIESVEPTMTPRLSRTGAGGGHARDIWSPWRWPGPLPN
jgi:hypothetical protein